jgi:hypothetical protein
MKNAPIHIRFGLLTAAVIIVSAIISYLAKLNMASSLQMPFVIGSIFIGVIFSCSTFKKNTPVATTQEVFFNGFRTTAIIALLVIGFALLFIALVPSFKETMFTSFSNAQLKDAGSDATKIAEANKNIADYKSRFTTMFIGINMMLIVIAGLLASALGAMFSKK